jgi:hypothetical protein
MYLLVDRVVELGRELVAERAWRIRTVTFGTYPVRADTAGWVERKVQRRGKNRAARPNNLQSG